LGSGVGFPYTCGFPTRGSVNRVHNVQEKNPNKKEGEEKNSCGGGRGYQGVREKKCRDSYLSLGELMHCFMVDKKRG